MISRYLPKEPGYLGVRETRPGFRFIECRQILTSEHKCKAVARCGKALCYYYNAYILTSGR